MEVIDPQEATDGQRGQRSEEQVEAQKREQVSSSSGCSGPESFAKLDKG